MRREIIQSTKTIALAIILAAGVQMVFADWSSAPSNPPLSNADAPINVSSATQAKLGALQLNKNTSGPVSAVGLSVWGNSATPIRIVDSTPGDDDKKVLTSDANGYASWQTPASFSGFTWTPANIGEDTESLVANNVKISYQIDHNDCSSANGGCYTVEGSPVVPATVDTCDGRADLTYPASLCPVSSNTTCNDWRSSNRCSDDTCASLYTVQCKLAQVPVKTN